MTDRNFKPDSGTDLVFEDAGSTDRLRITDGGSTILYEDGGTAALTIDTSGNVGIGTTSPESEMHLAAAGTNRETTFYIDTYNDQGSGYTNRLILRKSNSDVLGTKTETTDTERLGIIRFQGVDTGSNFDSGAEIAVWQDGSAGAKVPTYITFSTSTDSATAEAMRINKNGNVGIPTVNASHKLQVTGTAGLSTGTAWTNTSDERIKTNIKTIENALEKINQLRPISYNYSTDYLEQHPELNPEISYNSFLAQEYAEVFPDAVSVGENLEKVVVEAVEAKEAVLDKDGNEISPAVESVEEVREIIIEDMLQFTPHDLNMYLVGAVQELSAKVNALENA